MKLIKESIYVTPNNHLRYDNLEPLGMLKEDWVEIEAFSNRWNFVLYHFSRPRDYFWALKWLGYWKENKIVKMLDIGSGMPVWAAWVLQKHPDISVDCIEQPNTDWDGNAEKSYNELCETLPVRLKPTNMIFQEYKPGIFPDNSYNVVSCISSIEHFTQKSEEQKAYLKDIQRILQPGGLFLFTTDINSKLYGKLMASKNFDLIVLLRELGVDENLIKDANTLREACNPQKVKRQFLFGAFINEDSN